jgi:hypothetical protein
MLKNLTKYLSTICLKCPNKKLRHHWDKQFQFGHHESLISVSITRTLTHSHTHIYTHTHTHAHSNDFYSLSLSRTHTHTHRPQLCTFDRKEWNDPTLASKMLKVDTKLDYFPIEIFNFQHWQVENFLILNLSKISQ